jgi:uncharacterized protein YecE (DUF72 family)
MQGSAISTPDIGPFVYVRFHGPQRYGGRYSEEALDAWSDRLADQARAGRAIYAYFNNDTGGHAPRDAMRLRERLTQLVGTP